MKSLSKLLIWIAEYLRTKVVHDGDKVKSLRIQSADIDYANLADLQCANLFINGDSDNPECASTIPIKYRTENIVGFTSQLSENHLVPKAYVDDKIQPVDLSKLTNPTIEGAKLRNTITVGCDVDESGNVTNKFPACVQFPEVKLDITSNGKARLKGNIVIFSDSTIFGGKFEGNQILKASSISTKSLSYVEESKVPAADDRSLNVPTTKWVGTLVDTKIASIPPPASSKMTQAEIVAALKGSTLRDIMLNGNVQFGDPVQYKYSSDIPPEGDNSYRIPSTSWVKKELSKISGSSSEVDMTLTEAEYNQLNSMMNGY